MDTGGYHACALSADGNPVCWGNNSSGQASPPSGMFTQLALGSSHSCGLTTDSNVKCWGNNSEEQSKNVADMTYITAGYHTTCGIKTDGTASCWGESNGSYGYLSQIDFSVYGGDRISPNIESFLFCGLRADYSVSCPSTTSTPSGKFTYVTVSADIRYYNPPGCCDSDAYSPIHSFACGIRENGLVACWGENHKDRATAPVGIKMMQPKDFIPPQIANFTQADLDNAYATGKQESMDTCKSNPASCDIKTNNDISAIIGQDLSLHVSKATYETLVGSSTIWVDLIFAGENEEGDLTWILDKYGEVE
ncbi:RCC1 domain-containing protein [Thiotrichales bacterium HSG1]|nr:RCC1 domain-containing protein [Thiotrichales bacterium HSG1]